MKKIISIFFAILMTLSLFSITSFAKTEETQDKLSNIKAPQNFVYSITDNGSFDSIYLSYFASEEIANLLEQNQKDDSISYTVYMQTDWRINNGKWHYEENWETYPYQGFGFELNTVATKVEILITHSKFVCEDLNIKFGKNNHFDFSKNTLEMRSRYCVKIKPNKTGKNVKEETITSDWSKTVNVTRNKDFDSTKLATQFEFKNYKVYFDKALEKNPYIVFSINWTDDLKDAVVNILAHDNRILRLVCEKQKGNSKWTECRDINQDISDYFIYGDYTISIPATEIMSDAPIKYRISFDYDASNNSEIKDFKTSASEILTYDYLNLSNSKEENTEPVEIPENKEKESNNNILYIVLGVLVIIFVIFIVLVVKSRKNKYETLEETAENNKIEETQKYNEIENKEIEENNEE